MSEPQGSQEAFARSPLPPRPIRLTVDRRDSLLRFLLRPRRESTKRRAVSRPLAEFAQEPFLKSLLNHLHLRDRHFETRDRHHDAVVGQAHTVNTSFIKGLDGDLAVSAAHCKDMIRVIAFRQGIT